jgi:hypothetical protein
MRTRSGRPCTARKGARSNGLAVTGSAQAVGSANGRLIHHWVSVIGGSYYTFAMVGRHLCQCTTC